MYKKAKEIFWQMRKLAAFKLIKMFRNICYWKVVPKLILYDITSVFISQLDMIST